MIHLFQHPSIRHASWPKWHSFGAESLLIFNAEMFLECLQVYDLTPNKRHLELTIEHISTLALAHYFTGELKFAKRARDKAAAWFLNPETAMIAQFACRLAAVRRGGTLYGRPEGVYDMSSLPDLLNGVIMLSSTPAWSQDDSTRMLACASHPFPLNCLSNTCCTAPSAVLIFMHCCDELKG
jgi:hypothetical protein